MKPLVAPDGVAGDRHAFEHPNRERVQQHPVLEGAGLAFVGVADDVALGAGRVAGAVPFRPDREPGAAPPAQVRALHLVEHPLPPAGDRRVERDARGDRRQQGLAAADVVVDAEQLGRPFVERRPRPHQVADLVDPPHRQARNGAVVDQHRRALVAHAGVGGQIDAHQAVGRHLAALELQPAEHMLEQGDVARHAVGDVVGEQQAVTATRLVVQKRIELQHALHPRARNLQLRRDRLDRFRRNPIQRLLRLSQDLQDVSWIVPILLDDGRNNRIRGRHARALQLSTPLK